MTVGIAMCALLNLHASRRVTITRVLACVVADAVTLAIVARMYSPLLIAPGLGTLLVMATTITTVAPLWFASTVIPLLSTAAIVGPLVAERVGFISRTTTVPADGWIHLRVAAVVGNEVTVLLVAALYIVVLFGASAVFATAIRVRDQALKRRLHLQAWQLRQLVAR